MQLAPQKRTPCAQSVDQMLEKRGELVGTVKLKGKHTGALGKTRDIRGIAGAKALEDALEHREARPGNLDTPGRSGWTGEFKRRAERAAGAINPALGVWIEGQRGRGNALGELGFDLPDRRYGPRKRLLDNLSRFPGEAFCMRKGESTRQHGVKQRRRVGKLEETRNFGLMAAKQLTDNVQRSGHLRESTS